jgi:DNA-binding transcriptional MerR regulator
MVPTKREAATKRFKTKDICKIYDISRSTLFRWEMEGLITGVERDWRGWRIYHLENLKEIERIIKTKH